MQRSQLCPQVKPAVPARRSGPVPLDSKDFQRVAGGLPRGGGWESTESTQQLPRGGGWL
jgi:hypothetical protein